MDLRTYAVYKKLTQNSALLEYVVQGQPVPIEVVEENIEELIESLQHTESEALVDNYIGHLKDTVKTNFSKKEESVFDVSGQIDDRVIESIEWLHSVKREDVVRDVVEHVMMDLSGNREVIVDQITLTEDADAFLRSTTEPLFFEKEANQLGTSAFDTASNDVTNQTAQSSEDEPQELTLEPDALDQLLSNPVTETVEAETSTDTEQETEPVVDDDIANGEDMAAIEGLNSTLPDLDIQPEPSGLDGFDADAAYDAEVTDVEQAPEQEPEFEPEFGPENEPEQEPEFETENEPEFGPEFDPELEPEEAEYDPDDEPSPAEVFNQAYNFVVDELRAKGLDKKLPGLRLPQLQ